MRDLYCKPPLHLERAMSSSVAGASNCLPELLSDPSDENSDSERSTSPDIPFQGSKNFSTGADRRKQPRLPITPSAVANCDRWKPKTLIPARSTTRTQLRKNSTSRSSLSQMQQLARAPTLAPVKSHETDDCDLISDSEETRTASRKRHAQTDELEEVKSLLKMLVQKVEQNERSLNELQKSRSCGSGSAHHSPKTPKRKVPAAVRQEVRKVYRGLEDEEDFVGWTISPGKTIKSPENQSVLNKLVQEVKGLNPSFNAVDIREAGYRFYRSRCEEESARRRGKDVEQKVIKRRYERSVRKRKEREAALMKNTRLTDEQRQKWLQIMRNDFMSSEESEEDEIVVHPLPWRSRHVDDMFEKIDSYTQHRRSSQSRRQSKERKRGSASSRLCPIRTEELKWAFADTATTK